MSTYDTDGTILYVNENFENLFGYKAGELIGKNNTIFADEVTRQSAGYKDTWAKVLRGEPQRGEVKRIAKDGREVWFSTLQPDRGCQWQGEEDPQLLRRRHAAEGGVERHAGGCRMLSQAAVEGKLSTRADASKHEGDFRKIVEGVNDTLDAVIGPLNVAAIRGPDRQRKHPAEDIGQLQRRLQHHQEQSQRLHRRPRRAGGSQPGSPAHGRQRLLTDNPRVVSGSFRRCGERYQGPPRPASIT